MEVLVEIVKNLLVIIIMTSFLELLLPGGTMKSYVRFAIGLFVLISILQPVFSIMFAQNTLKVDYWKYSGDYSGEQILEKGSNINNSIFQAHQEELKEKIEGQINAVAILVPGVNDVESSVKFSNGGSIRSISIIVKPETKEETIGSEKTEGEQEREQISNKIKTILRNIYGLESTDIIIEFRGGN